MVLPHEVGQRKALLCGGTPPCSFKALLAFGVATGLALASPAAKTSGRFLDLVNGITFTLSCAASSLAFLAVFVRFAKKQVRVFDSLQDNAYGMYLILYAFVSWLQYALLKAHFPAIAKGGLYFWEQLC